MSPLFTRNQWIRSPKLPCFETALQIPDKKYSVLKMTEFVWTWPYVYHFFSIGTSLRRLNLTGIFPLNITEKNLKVSHQYYLLPKWPKTVKCAEDSSIKTTNFNTVQSVTFLFFIHDKHVLFTWRYQRIIPCALEVKLPTALCFICMLLTFNADFFSGKESPACCLLVTEDWLYNWTSINELLQLYIKKVQTKTWKTKLCL